MAIRSSEERRQEWQQEYHDGRRVHYRRAKVLGAGAQVLRVQLGEQMSCVQESRGGVVHGVRCGLVQWAVWYGGVACCIRASLTVGASPALGALPQTAPPRATPHGRPCAKTPSSGSLHSYAACRAPSTPMLHASGRTGICGQTMPFARQSSLLVSQQIRCHCLALPCP